MLLFPFHLLLGHTVVEVGVVVDAERRHVDVLVVEVSDRHIKEIFPLPSLVHLDLSEGVVGRLVGLNKFLDELLPDEEDDLMVGAEEGDCWKEETREGERKWKGKGGELRTHI